MSPRKPDNSNSSPPRLRALILEDNPRDAELCAARLKQGGYDVQFEIADSQEAFKERLACGEFDIVIADYNLRTWTAMDALEILKQLGKDIPLIVSTGSLGDEPAVECVKQGAADFVLKDRPARLPVAVERALGEKRLREERERALAALQESEEQYRLLFRDNPHPMWVYDLESLRFLEVNDAAVEHYGYTREEFLAMTIKDLRPPEDVPALEENVARVSTGLDRAGTWMHRKKNGEIIDVEITSRAILFGRRRAEVVLANDITERKRTEEENLRLITAIEQSAEAVLITDTQGNIEYVNPAFGLVTGYSREEVLGKNPRILKSGQHDFAFYAEMWKTIREGRVWHGEVVNRRKDGSLYTEEMNITPVRSSRGEITHFIAAKQDVTARKQLEEQFRQAQKMEAVGRLAGGVAHDFNNLLTIINGYSQLLLEKLDPASPLRAQVDEIQKSGERAAELTQQLLAFSRRQVLNPQVLDLNQVVQDTHKMLHRLIGEDIDCRMVLHPELWQIKADPGQIAQILMNLAVNARDAMPQGGTLTIQTSNVQLSESYGSAHAEVIPGGYVVLGVSDTGIGMDRETQARIFEPFFTTKEQGKGTGLGLATVYGIVKQSGGYIWVYSEPGKGTTFKVYLPSVKGEVQAGPPSRVRRKTYTGTETILLVEDDAAVRQLVAEVLKSQGYLVLAASDPEEAAKTSASYEKTIDLLLTDLIMPKLNGRQLAEHLTFSRPTMKVMFMSGYTDDAVLRHGVVSTGVAYIQKPFTPQALIRKVRGVLDAPQSGLHP